MRPRSDQVKVPIDLDTRQDSTKEEKFEDMSFDVLTVKGRLEANDAESLYI